MIQPDTPTDDSAVLTQVIDLLLDYWLSQAGQGQGDDDDAE